jgi:hypothetical protein
MGFPEELTKRWRDSGVMKDHIIAVCEITRYKLNGFMSGEIIPKRWEREGLMMFLDSVGIKGKQ